MQNTGGVRKARRRTIPTSPGLKQSWFQPFPLGDGNCFYDYWSCGSYFYPCTCALFIAPPKKNIYIFWKKRHIYNYIYILYMNLCYQQLPLMIHSIWHHSLWKNEDSYLPETSSSQLIKSRIWKYIFLYSKLFTCLHFYIYYCTDTVFMYSRHVYIIY